jgi:hypothetical protein
VVAGVDTLARDHERNFVSDHLAYDLRHAHEAAAKSIKLIA